jgi:hypothetical protein
MKTGAELDRQVMYLCTPRRRRHPVNAAGAQASAHDDACVQRGQIRVAGEIMGLIIIRTG